jgi:predicted RNase H-like nuclease (RuvC/YqgF family)
VSNGAPKDTAADRHGLPALEAAVSRTVEELRELRKRTADAVRRSDELQALLERFQTGSESPELMKSRLEHLEAENRDLRARIEQGREGVERLLARIQFLEDQK